MREVGRSAKALMVFVGILALTCRESQATPRRAVYVQDPTAVMAGPSHDRLLHLIDAREISDVVPYGLGPLLENPGGRAIVAMWIDELHVHGARVIAPIAGASRLVALDELFRAYPQTYLDGVVTELEFWNAEDRATAFDSMLALVRDMRARSSTWNNRALRVGAYLGYPTTAESSRLVRELDFVFLNYSVTSPERAWMNVHGNSSLRARYAAFSTIERWPIFYATGEVDMRAALKARGLASAERTFVSAVAADPELSRFTPTGFVYFTFESMP